MDGVELPCPVDVAFPLKLMGSEGCGGFRVMENETQNKCEPPRVSMHMNHSIERCSVSTKQKDAGSDSPLESSLRQNSLLSRNVLHERLADHIETSCKPCSSKCINDLGPHARPGSAELQRKAGKMSRNGNGPSKRVKVAFLEAPASSARDNDTKDKTQTVKQRNSFSGKRCDKRNSKLPVRTMPNFSSASGENAFFGVYGLKPEINDVTSIVGDLPLNELLEGSCACPALGKDKGNNVVNPNETLLNLVRKACSVLPAQRPIQSQNSAETDGYASKPLSSPNSVSLVANGETGDKGISFEADPLPSCEDHSSKAEISSNPLNFPLFNAMDVVERLSLPPPRNLDSLLQDATKPPQYSRSNSDPRSGKEPLRSVGLPHFPWSHNFIGNCKTNSEAAKFLTGRTPCHGQWERSGKTVSSSMSMSDTFSNLESLPFDQKLVPSRQKQNTTGSGSLPHCQCALSFVSMVEKASNVPLDNGMRLNDQNNETMHCPRLLAAAQTLCDIATQFPKHNLNRILKWPKKLSQKCMKARKSKSIKTPEERHTPLDSSSNNNKVRKYSAELIKPSKRPKLVIVENINGSPSASATEITAERRYSSANYQIKQLCTIPPPMCTSEKPPLGNRK